MITIIKKLFIFSFLFFLCSTYIHALSLYRIVDLNLQESDQSEAVAVNDRGQVTGSYWILGKRYYYLWQENQGITLIDLPKSSNITVLNNKGQICGNYKNNENEERGFLWDPHEGFIDIGTLGGKFTKVYDMNDLGEIVGESEAVDFSDVDGNSSRYAFFWHKGTMLNLGSLTGPLGLNGDKSIATGINNLSQIIGTSNYLIPHKARLLRSENRPVIWKDGNIEEIDYNIKGDAKSYSINDCSLAIYSISDITTPYKNHIIKLSSNNNHNLIPFQGISSGAIKINDRATMLVFNTDNFSHTNDANILFLWNNSTHNNYNTFNKIDLNLLFKRISTSKWKSFVSACDINNNNWVVGSAKNIYGETHGILLIPTP